MILFQLVGVSDVVTGCQPGTVPAVTILIQFATVSSSIGIQFIGNTEPTEPVAVVPIMATFTLACKLFTAATLETPVSAAPIPKLPTLPVADTLVSATVLADDTVLTDPVAVTPVSASVTPSLTSPTDPVAVFPVILVELLYVRCPTAL